ncbi:PaaX family transcriptional regulator [Corynebacterium sp. A21]|uniref:PaaX family transcriptional regulator n=1 Tax=Corynebacterium sp. A21 TaxID=3457318 RepID=UPI003FD0460F
MIAKPKELVMDLFGDYVRYMGGSIRLGQLTQLLEIFGVEPATARVTLSRMKKEGWFLTERHGREIEYCATEKFMSVLDEGRERIFARSQPVWIGRWTLVIFGAGGVSRSEVRKITTRLEWQGFSQLNSSSWICPRDLRESIRGKYGTDDGAVMVSNMWTGSLGEDRRLAGECWDLAGIAVEYREFMRRWREELGKGVAELTPREALIARVQMVNEYRNFIYRDPLMPRALLPAGWPGEEVFSFLTDMHRDLGPQAMEQVAEVMFDEGSDHGMENKI